MSDVFTPLSGFFNSNKRRNVDFPAGIAPASLTQEPLVLTLIRLSLLLALFPVCLLVYSLEELPHLACTCYREQQPRHLIDDHHSSPWLS